MGALNQLYAATAEEAKSSQFVGPELQPVVQASSRPSLTPLG